MAFAGAAGDVDEPITPLEAQAYREGRSLRPSTSKKVGLSEILTSLLSAGFSKRRSQPSMPKTHMLANSDAWFDEVTRLPAICLITGFRSVVANASLHQASVLQRLYYAR